MCLGAAELNNNARFANFCPSGPYRFGPGNPRNQCDTFHYWSMHPSGAHFLFADGSLRFL